MANIRRLAIILVALLGCTLQAQDPDAATITRAINEAPEMHFREWQTLTDLTILKGGSTGAGERLYLCNARIVWRYDRETMLEGMSRDHLDSSDELYEFRQMVLGLIMEQAGELKAGELVTLVRLRVRLQRAGDDWLVSEITQDFDRPNILTTILNKTE